jgi:hypothetical protein
MEQYYKPVFVTFANIEMTSDAFIVLLSGIFMFLFLSLTNGLNYLYLIILLVYGIMAYQINCMHVGSCHFYAKYLSIATLINVLFFTLYSKSKDKTNIIKNLTKLN